MRVLGPLAGVLTCGLLCLVACSDPGAKDDQRTASSATSGTSSRGTDATPPQASAEVPASPVQGRGVAPKPQPKPTVSDAVAGQDGLPTIDALPDPSTIADSPKGLINGDFAPELDLHDLASGQQFKLSDRVGPQARSPRGAVVVSFTASWCGPCRASLPYLKEMEEKFPELDVVLVTMDNDKAGRDKELSQLRASGLQAPLLVPDQHTLRAWLGRKRNIPHLYIINAAGEVLVQDRGFGKKVRKVLPRQIGYALRHPEYVVRAKKVR